MMRRSCDDCHRSFFTSAVSAAINARCLAYFLRSRRFASSSPVILLSSWPGEQGWVLITGASLSKVLRVGHGCDLRTAQEERQRDEHREQRPPKFQPGAFPSDDLPPGGGGRFLRSCLRLGRAPAC